MRSIRTFAASAFASAAALVFVSAAVATAPLRGTFPIGLHATFPAGTFCGFDVSVDIDGTGTFAIYDDPRNIQHAEQRKHHANDRTLLVNDHWNVTTTPPSSPAEEQGVFTQRGAAFHIQAPGSGMVLLDAGYLVTLFPDGALVVAHGRFPFEVGGDVSSVCAALTP